MCMHCTALVTEEEQEEFDLAKAANHFEREKPTVEAIEKLFEEHCPPISDEMMKEIKSHFETNYMFFKTLKKNPAVVVREFWCAECEKHFTMTLHCPGELTDNGTDELMRSKHNENVKCPYCQNVVILKNVSFKRSGLNREMYAALMFSDCSERVFVKSSYITCEFPQGNPLPKIRITEPWFMSVLTPRKQYTVEWNCGRYILCPKPTDYFVWSYGAATPYDCIGLKDCLENTFLKYSCYYDFRREWTAAYRSRIPHIKYLSMYCEVPCFEMLLKIGAGKLVCDYVLNEPNRRLYDWSQTNPMKFFRLLSHEEVKGIIKNGIPRDLKNRLKQLKFFRKIYPKMQLKDTIPGLYISRNFFQEHVDIVRKHKKSFTSFTNYIVSQKRGVGYWLDYIDMARKLKLDLDYYRVAFPKNLVEAHDGILKQIGFEKDRQSQEKFDKRAKELEKMYAFENDEFTIVIPCSQSDIIAEGKALCHCVGGYAERHADGKTTILFLRKKSDVMTPLYTIEVSDKTKEVIQIQGYANRTPLTPEAKAFFEEWKEFIKRPKKQAKKKTAA